MARGNDLLTMLSVGGVQTQAIGYIADGRITGHELLGEV